MEKISKLNKLEGLNRSLDITVPKQEYITIFNNSVKEYITKVKLDGFRAGKVPENVIIKKYKDKIHFDVINKIIEISVSESLSENKLHTASPTKLSIKSEASFENDLKFSVEFEIYPLFQLSALDKISIEEPEVDITDADINGVISNIQKQNIKWEESKVVAKSGDKVVVDYNGFIEGKKIEDISGENFTFIIDDKIKGDNATVKLYEAFYRNSLDEKVGAEKKFTFNMATDYIKKEIAGKTVDYTINIKHIYHGLLPDLNNEFYKKLGLDKSTHENFKKNVLEHMTIELEQRKQSILSASINDELLKHNDFEIPKNMLDNEKENIRNQYKSMMKELDEKSKLELETIAIKRVKLNIIYMKLAQEHNIEVSDNDVYDFISKSSQSTQNELVSKAKEDKNYLNQIKNKIIEDGIINKIKNKCKITKIKKNFSEVVN
ncbi:MAG: trigger factor [Gammaproteobacteria bacterium]|nr:trigger factor [Gammaproteobacteria bacterium]